jgi:hypothetical protein
MAMFSSLYITIVLCSTHTFSGNNGGGGDSGGKGNQEGNNPKCILLTTITINILFLQSR